MPEQCPDCGGAVSEDHLDQQFQTEIPRQPIVREFKIHCGHRQKCGKHLRGRHPLQTSDATGAAQSQLGGDAQAAIVYLNKRAGMFLYLVDPDIPATNHRAEQGLKTPIVNRKVWGGNRTDAGGAAQSVTSSVLQTCQNKAIDVFQFVSNSFRGVLGNFFA